VTFVLDASVALSWCFADQVSPATLSIHERLVTERAIVPTLWLYEVANALTVAARRGRMSTEKATQMAGLLVSLPIDLTEPQRDLTGLIQLATEHNLSSYDCAYLQLAITSDLPLATLDDRLRTAAAAAGIRTLTDIAEV
jgi:predicted nucleic acid-binding protein